MHELEQMLSDIWDGCRDSPEVIFTNLGHIRHTFRLRTMVGVEYFLAMHADRSDDTLVALSSQGIRIEEVN